MWALPLVAVVTLVAFLLRRSRWAEVSLLVSRWTYAVVMPLSLLYFPMKAGWRVRPVDCEWTFGLRLAIYSLGNLPHMIMFAVFFILSYAQFPPSTRRLTWSFAVCLVMGFLVEVAEGATGIHHCRMRDLIPDMAGAVLGALIVVSTCAVWRRRAMNRPS